MQQTTLRRLEGDKTTNGGFLITYPSGAAKTVVWQAQEPISPVLEAAKEFAAKALDERLSAGSYQALQDADNTNWPSVVAAIGTVIGEFNARLGVLKN